MKLLLLTLLLPAISFAQSDSIFAGMNSAQFKAVFPGLLPEPAVYSGTVTFTYPAVFSGKWNFRFDKDILRGIGYHEESFKTQQLFNKKLEEINVIIGYYTGKIGVPVAEETGDLEWQKPESRKREKDRDVIRCCTWETWSMTIKAGLYYTGNNGVKPDNKPNGAPATTYYELQVELTAKDPGKRNKVLKEEKFFYGMHIRDFIAANREVFPRGKPGLTGQWTSEAELYELKGGWHYRFDNDTLKSAAWNCYGKRDSVSETDFNRFLQAGQKMIEQRTGLYGKPVKFKSDTKYRKAVQGYSVLDANWKKDNRNIRVRFDYFGGKGEYYFVLEMTDEV